MERRKGERGWARRSIWAAMAGSRVREEGVCLFLAWRGQEEGSGDC